MYNLVKIWVRLGLQFYCSRIIIDKEYLVTDTDKPIILACAHPNSFFDAIVIAAYYPRQMHFLARGDAFQKKWAASLLRLLNLMPVYRISEGKENLGKNRNTFDISVDILKHNGVVLVFSEGISENEWTLRRLKKGTARVARMAWYDEGVDDMEVQPVGITYHSFAELPKRIFISYQPSIYRQDITEETPAHFYNTFNEVLTDKLQSGIVTPDNEKLKPIKTSAIKKVVLGIPALIGWILHKPLYNIWKSFVRNKTRGTVFYDSVLFAGLVLLYPLLVLILTIVVVSITGIAWLWLLIMLLPFTAWSYKEFRS